MRKVFLGFMVFAVAAGGLAGCQSAQQSAANAEMTCEAAGLRPGTRRFERCANVNYAQNRAQASQTEAAVATAAAAGVLGGALVGAAASRPVYYGPAYYPVYRAPYWW
ncbi:hypothetical protein SS37A_38900 (plasmid) [Methylocystis iwaonis]|uniref:Lipoprotein n=1 Tax=Methylocystis iwaonis TaxID=2885079 RepID=A0ABM8EEA5_9HYPH|nr:hypothetical protein SS37A_38900 [Methylocystis iwaonis]